MTITDIAWDFDGTLCDSYPHIASSFQKALEAMGIHESEADIMRWVTISVPDALAHYHQIYGIDIVETRTHFAYWNDQADYAKVKPFPHVKEALGHVIALGGRNHLYTHRRGTSTASYLKHYGLDSFFTIAFTADKGYPRKPDPTALLELMAKGGISPGQLMMVGDRSIDIDAAYNAHARSCFFNSNHFERPEHATWAVDDYLQFITLLDKVMRP